MISILSQPYACIFTRNSAELQVQTNMQYPSERVFPKMQLKCNGKLLAGDFIELSFLNPETGAVEVIRLTANNADIYPGSVPNSLFAGTVDEYAEEFEARLRKIPALNGWYIITRVGKTITLTASEADDRLIFTNVNTNQSTLNVDPINYELLNDPDPREGYGMRAVVYFEHQYNSGTFEAVARLNLVADENSVAQIDVADILNTELENSWSAPPMPVNTVAAADLLRRYYIEFIEFWDDEPAGFTTITDTLYCHWGGVSRHDELMIEPIAYLQANNHFLSFIAEYGKQLYPAQQDWLSWMNTGLAGTFDVVVRLYKNTGTQDEVINTIALNRWETVTFPTGYQQLDLESYLSVGESIIKWAFVMQQSTIDVTSESFFYLMESTNCLYNQLLFFNNFGAPETIALSGQFTETIAVDKLLAERSQQFNSNRLVPANFVFDQSHQVSYTAITPIMGKQEAWYMQSVFNSELAFLWDSVIWEPVIVTTDKADTKTESEFITQLKVEMIIANRNDRTSFFVPTPELQPVYNCSLESYTIQQHGIEISDYGTVTVKNSSGSTTTTATWDGTQYVCVAPITSPGQYDATVTVEDVAGNTYDLSVSYTVKRQRIECTYNQSGLLGFYIASSESSESLRIDWGNGDGFETRPYTDVIGFLGKTLSVTGNKKMIWEKNCFDDIIQLEVVDMYFTGFNFQMLRNLEYLALNATRTAGTLYLNGMSQLQDITLVDLEITALSIGIMPVLNSIHIESCANFNDTSVENLITQIWELRKHFTNPIDVYFGFNATDTFPDKSQAMISGTGIYAGEGLSADYGFTFFIE